MLSGKKPKPDDWLKNEETTNVRYKLRPPLPNYERPFKKPRLEDQISEGHGSEMGEGREDERSEGHQSEEEDDGILDVKLTTEGEKKLRLSNPFPEHIRSLPFSGQTTDLAEKYIMDALQATETQAQTARIIRYNRHEAMKRYFGDIKRLATAETLCNNAIEAKTAQERDLVKAAPRGTEEHLSACCAQCGHHRPRDSAIYAERGWGDYREVIHPGCKCGELSIRRECRYAQKEGFSQPRWQRLSQLGGMELPTRDSRPISGGLTEPVPQQATGGRGQKFPRGRGRDQSNTPQTTPSNRAAGAGPKELPRADRTVVQDVGKMGIEAKLGAGVVRAATVTSFRGTQNQNRPAEPGLVEGGGGRHRMADGKFERDRDEREGRAGILHLAKNRETVQANQLVVDIVQNGYKCKWTGSPRQDPKGMRTIVQSEKEKTILFGKMQEFVDKGAIEECTNEFINGWPPYHCIVSPTFMSYQESRDKWRQIGDYRGLNAQMEKFHFKMETMESTKAFMARNSAGHFDFMYLIVQEFDLFLDNVFATFQDNGKRKYDYIGLYR
ncbi:hypothetical protein DFS34DRAFT_595613 [Phlyctochytrium arcticum]|nr:hypothetical protein DFS34DRAFT_595613 [Phlyctochytrium arcticum]